MLFSLILGETFLKYASNKKYLTFSAHIIQKRQNIPKHKNTSTL